MTQEQFDANNFNDYEYCCCSVVKHQQTVAGLQLDPYELTLDKLHRLTKEQYPDAGNPKTQYFEYKYDNAGRRVEMTDPTYGRAAVEPKPQSWAYDEDGMLIGVGHSQNIDYLRNRGEDYGVMYDSRGRISKVLYPGDNNQPVMEVEYQYNDAGQIMKIIARDLTKGAVTDIYCMEYGYDANGRKIRQVVKEQEADEDTDAYYVTTFNYDSRDMLTDEKYLRWDNANTIWKVMYWGHYNYDTAGNMVNRVVSQIVNGVAKMYIDGPFTYSRGYQLRYFNRTDPGNAETRAYNLTYDANGNVTHIQRQQGQQPFTDSFYEITEMEFDYDAKNRLVKYRFGGAGSWCDIKYDALGRVRERVDLTPTTTKYYLDGRQLVQQLDNSNTVQFDYLRGPTGLDRQWNETNDTRRFYIKDNLGTVWAIVNPSDLSVKRYNYNAWGEHLDKDDTDFPTDTNWMRYIGCGVEAFGKGITTQRDVIYWADDHHYIPLLPQYFKHSCHFIDHKHPGNIMLPPKPILPPDFYPLCCQANLCFSDFKSWFDFYISPKKFCCCKCKTSDFKFIYYPDDKIFNQVCRAVTFDSCRHNIIVSCGKADISDWAEGKCPMAAPPCSKDEDCFPISMLHMYINCKQTQTGMECLEGWRECTCSFKYIKGKPKYYQYGECISYSVCIYYGWTVCE